MKGFFTSRKFRQGSMATAITVVVVALIVVVNMIATTLTDRYSLTLDLTPTKLFSITNETKEYLADIDRDVTIYVLDREETFGNTQAVEVLKKFALESPRITLEYVDLVANPTFPQNYPSLQLSTGSILVTCGDKARDVSQYDLYDFASNEYGQRYVTASKAEQTLTSAILSVTSDVTYNVAVVSGHNEVDVSGLTTLLGKNNYLSGTVDLATTEIDPAVYDVAIIASPERDFSEDELRRLDTFLQNGDQFGKALLYFASATQSSLSNLNDFLADWGIAIEPGIVLESDYSNILLSSTGQYNPFMAYTLYAESDFSEPTDSKGMRTIAPYGAPLSRVFDSKDGITTSTLLEYAGTAGILISQDQIREPDGARIPYATKSSYLTYSGSKAHQSHVLVFGSSDFVAGDILGNPNYANSEYSLNVLAGLIGREDTVRIQSKELAAGTITITAQQAILTGLLLVVIFPLALLIFGIVIWARRRHR